MAGRRPRCRCLVTRSRWDRWVRGRRVGVGTGCMPTSMGLSVWADAADREQLQAQVADLGEQAVQGRLVGDQSGDGGLAGLVAADLQPLKPGRPAGVQHAPDAKLIARRLGGRGTFRPAAHLVSRATAASRIAVPDEPSATMAYRWAMPAHSLVSWRRASSRCTRR